MARGQRGSNNRPSDHKSNTTPVAQRYSWGGNTILSKGDPGMQLLKYHIHFFNDNSIISWIPLRNRGVRFLWIGGKGIALCRCFDGHNKNPTECLWHGSPTITSVQPHIYMYVLSQIWLKHLPMWRKTKTSHFNSSLYVYFPIHTIHICIYNRFIIWKYYFCMFVSVAISSIHFQLPLPARVIA